MAEDPHCYYRSKVCFCGKKAIQEIKQAEEEKLNATREENEKIDFKRLSFPIGICKRCDIYVRLKRPIKFGLWNAHAKAGLHQNAR